MNDTHSQGCPIKFMNHSDAAKRIRDVYELHRLGAGNAAINKWIACKLEDGSSDNVLYDSKLDAVKHQHHNEQFYMFIKIPPSGMTVCEAEILLTTHRRMYEKGLRMTDPDHRHGGPDLIKRLTWSDQLAAMRGAVTGLILPGYDKN